MSAACMPFCLSQIHSSLSCWCPLHLVGTKQIRHKSSRCWQESFSVLVIKSLRLFIASQEEPDNRLCPVHVPYIIWSMCKPGMTNNDCFGLFLSSQESGRLKPLHVICIASEAWWAFLSTRLRRESHLGQFSTLLQLHRFSRLPFETMRTL